MKPPIKWPGGKRNFVNTFRKAWEVHDHRVLVEPFCGACAVGLGLEVEYALMNDFNPHLVNFWWFVQAGYEIDLEMEHDRDLYYHYRSKFNRRIQDFEYITPQAAELFYYLNKTGFNGLFRVNKNGMYNVPFGDHKKVTYQTNFAEYEQVIKHWAFSFGDFEDTPVEAGMFIYADPPYDDGFNAFTEQGFTWADQVRLARWLAGHHGPVVASNKATPRIVDLYMDNGFDVQYLSANRSISADGNREQVLEIIATRNIS